MRHPKSSLIVLRHAPIPKGMRTTKNGLPLYVVCPKCSGMNDGSAAAMCITCGVQYLPATAQEIADFKAFS